MRFGAFTFDVTTRQLIRGAEPVHLSPKAFELLGVLVRHRPVAVAKADLHRELWPDTFVSDGSLAVLVAEIRRALGDSANHPVFVRTVNRFGYAFVCESEEDGSEALHLGGGASYSLTWGHERARLKAGRNVVGRDPDADVFIDAVGVSRRHAMIVVSRAAVTLYDLNSKNGTFANGVRVVSPVLLPDSAEIRLGALSLRFHRLWTTAETQTVAASP